MLKFTALLSDQFRQSSSISSLKNYHQLKNQSITFDTYQQPTPQFQSAGKRVHTDVGFSSYTFSTQDKNARGRSHSELSWQKRKQHARGISETEIDYLKKKYTGCTETKKQSENMQRSMKGKDMQNIPIFLDLPKHIPSRQQTQPRKRNEQYESCQHTKKANYDENMGSRQKGQQKMRASRLSNLQTIQKKIEATLNIRNKLLI